MAKRQGLDDIFKKTEQEAGGVDLSDLDAGPIKATGVGLRVGELEALEKIGAELGEQLNTEPVARNALVRIAVRELIKNYRAGRLDLLPFFEAPEKPKPKTRF